jgi:four helix bundle protein
MGEFVTHFQDLRVYKSSRSIAKKIFNLTKSWPREERYALTDQIRRSSRSVGANIAEAWRKRRYVAHFTSKLSDSDSEVAETQSWLDDALDCSYISAEVFKELDMLSGGLVKMMDNPAQWCGPGNKIREEPESYLDDPQTPILPHSHT